MNKRFQTQESRRNFLLHLFRAFGIVSFIVAGILLALMIVMRIDGIRERYDQYLVVLATFENRVASLKNRWLIVIVIMLLYTVRSLTPMYPFPVLYIITAMVFSPVNSFVINMTGMGFNMAFRYYTGVQMGEGMWNKILHKHPEMEAVFEVDAKWNPLVLFALRFVSGIPFGTISHLYGTFEYPFVKYMLISMLALVPRLVSYSFIGNNVYDPMSSRFSVPLIVLFIITGISFFVMQRVYQLVVKSSDKKELSAGGTPPAERTENTP